MATKRWATWAEGMLLSELKVAGTIASYVYKTFPASNNFAAKWICATPNGFLLQSEMISRSRGLFEIWYGASPLFVPIYPAVCPTRIDLVHLPCDRAILDYSFAHTINALEFSDHFDWRFYETKEVFTYTRAVLRDIVLDYFRKIDSVKSYCREIDQKYETWIKAIPDRQKTEAYLIEPFSGWMVRNAEEAHERTIKAAEHLQNARVVAGLPPIRDERTAYHAARMHHYAYYYVCAYLRRYEDVISWFKEECFISKYLSKEGSFWENAASKFPYGKELIEAAQNRDKAACDNILEQVYLDNRAQIVSAWDVDLPKDWRKFFP